MKKVISLSLALALSFVVFSQEVMKEGIIISKQTMSSDNEQMKAQLAMMGEMESITYFKGAKTRAELSNPMSGNVTTITDAETKETLTLMDNLAMGKKYMLQKTEITDEQLDKITVVVGDKTKTVLGYECKQYIVTMNEEAGAIEMELYTTESIPVATQQLAMLGNKLKGFPLYMTVKINQMGSVMIITTEVTEIKREAVSDDKFDMTPPEGYEKMSKQ